MSTIDTESFLTLHYRMRGPDGHEVISTFGGMPATLSIGGGQLSPAIERRLLGLEEGAHAVCELPRLRARCVYLPKPHLWILLSSFDPEGETRSRT